MNVTEIKTKAKGLNIKIGKLRKGDLIRTIQTKEGNFPCFETAKEYCSQKVCCWREACLPSKKTIKGWEKKKKIYTTKLTGEVKEFKERIAVLEKKAKNIVGGGKEELLDDIDKLKKMLAAIKKKSQKFAAASEEAGKITKKGLDLAWNDLSKAMKKAAKKFK
ncbi:MAG: hypothetical protein KAS94_04340 [Desulfobulbaceae bacterium]|nr:hypothetical protein [Desulfobulbaceae bacterium]